MGIDFSSPWQRVDSLYPEVLTSPFLPPIPSAFQRDGNFSLVRIASKVTLMGWMVSVDVILFVAWSAVNVPSLIGTSGT
jgi:hypothetical protein